MHESGVLAGVFYSALVQAERDQERTNGEHHQHERRNLKLPLCDGAAQVQDTPEQLYHGVARYLQFNNGRHVIERRVLLPSIPCKHHGRVSIE